MLHAFLSRLRNDITENNNVPNFKVCSFCAHCIIIIIMIIHCCSIWKGISYFSLVLCWQSTELGCLIFFFLHNLYVQIVVQIFFQHLMMVLCFARPKAKMTEQAQWLLNYSSLGAVKFPHRKILDAVEFKDIRVHHDHEPWAMSIH